MYLFNFAFVFGGQVVADLFGLFLARFLELGFVAAGYEAVPVQERFELEPLSIILIRQFHGEILLEICFKYRANKFLKFSSVTSLSFSCFFSFHSMMTRCRSFFSRCFSNALDKLLMDSLRLIMVTSAILSFSRVISNSRFSLHISIVCLIFIIRK